MVLSAYGSRICGRAFAAHGPASCMRWLRWRPPPMVARDLAPRREMPDQHPEREPAGHSPNRVKLAPPGQEPGGFR